MAITALMAAPKMADHQMSARCCSRRHCTQRLHRSRVLDRGALACDASKLVASCVGAAGKAEMADTKGGSKLDGSTVRDLISPWAGVAPVETVGGARFASFGERIRAAFVPFIESYAGAEARKWVTAEIAEHGEPGDMVSALALGHALLSRIPEGPTREVARRELDALLRGIKITSLVPPPVSAGRAPRRADLDRRRNR